MNPTLHLSAVWLLRLSLAAGFISASVDRLGGWGAPGSPGVVWGAWAPFVDYTAQVLSFLPSSWAGSLGLLATVSEVGLGLWLVAGFRVQLAALASAGLLLAFALAMTVSFGIKSPLDYSVFTAAAAALALASLTGQTGSRAGLRA
ncbi:MAG: DoxX family protein [Verrucomicrobiota bacterium]